MMIRSFTQRAAQWLAVAVLLGVGFAAMAQTEPTLNQVYEAAQSGRMDQAQVMMQQVLVAHPKSAKAHFVQAELSARQGQLGRARESLAQAEKLAPGLPFAKPQAVQNLRAMLTASAGAPATGRPAARATPMATQTAPPAPVAAPAPASSSAFPTGLGLALGGGAIAAAIFLLRRKPAPQPGSSAVYSNAAVGGSGLSGPQRFGMDAGASSPVPGQPSYAQAGNGQPGYGQAPGSGIGGRVVGGLATGLAVGAGVMAAQAIGKSLMGGHGEQPAHPVASAGGNDVQPLAGNNDMGGQNFGVNDAGSWDDASSMASIDDGGDWDS